ncbi:hypothetical protein [Planctomyces sp. SH-PL62]|uniref:hypothetical protein n=1 Tax=Planctomyces sp. SH-PL62 TaxID=1636152 RepID=UPI00078D6DBD|nr:hypothetical protein [Planctomyces sp. SH-PL62]AMV37317.1 hypothetical protein VT85_07780 [Planctomyces sp. SH-PL62]
MSRRRVGRSLQLLGLILVPFGIASELNGAVGLRGSLLISGTGMVGFYLGRLIQGPS